MSRRQQSKKTTTVESVKRACTALGVAGLITQSGGGAQELCERRTSLPSQLGETLFLLFVRFDLRVPHPLDLKSALEV
jgi:hypothetical protein